MPDASADKAEQLLDAQVRFFEAQLEPAQLRALLEQELDQVLAAAAQLTLAQVVTREQITAVALKYTVAMKIPGSIPELASEIAGRIYSHPAQADNRLDDVIGAKHIEAFTTKLLELPLVQERLIESPLMIEIVAEWLYRIATETAAHNRELAGRIPGLSALLGTGGSLLGRVAPDAGIVADTRLRELAEQTARIVLRSVKGTANTPEQPWLHDTVVDMWREQADKPVSSLRDYLTQEDLEDLFVLLYDFWLSLRETAYLQALISAGVELFFEKYEDMTLLGLLEEFGISRADLIEEANRFAPPIIDLLRENGMLSAFLRRRLEPFFRSEAARALLGDPSD
jgi:hypothetical protein